MPDNRSTGFGSEPARGFTLSVGHILTVAGSCTITRSCGVPIQITPGDPVCQGDIIETDAGGKVGIRLIDGTAINLSDRGRMTLKQFACDKASPSALLDIDRGTFAFIAGKMAEGGRLGIDTPFASIRGRANSGGIGMLSIASLFFVAMEEARSATSEVFFLDDGVINFRDSQDYKDAKFGVIQLFVKGDQPHVISLDDASETIVLRLIGSSISESRITNSIDQMLKFQGDQHDVMHVLSLQGPTNYGPSGSGTPPTIEFQTFVQPISFTPPDAGGPQNLNLNFGPSNSIIPLTLDVILPPPPPPPAGAGQINELFNTTGQPIVDSTTTTLPLTILSLSEPAFDWSGGSLTVAQQTTLANASTSPVPGSTQFTYSIVDSAVDFLAVNETLTVTYQVTFSDGSTQPVAITVFGTNDAPNLAVDVSGLHQTTELIDTTGALSLDQTSGTLAFADADLQDTHTVNKSLVSAIWSGGATLPAGLATVLDGALSTTLHDSTGLGSGSIDFTFSAADSNFDFLAVGETLTVTYNIAVTDNNHVSSVQQVTITVHGTEDVPVITSGAQSGSVTEIVDNAVGENVTVHHQSGTVTFTDVDLSDIETKSITSTQVTPTLANSYTLTAAQQNALVNAFTLDAATHSTIDGTGTVGWHYDISDGALDFLGATDQVVLTFTVQVNDGHGGTASQDVTITVHGTEDVPVVTTTSNSFAELPGTNNPNTDSVSGMISFNDVDLSDRPTVTTAFSGYTYFGADGITALALTGPQQTAILKALVLGPTPATSNGSVTWTYSVADNALDFLAQNETLTLTYNAKVDDHHGGIVTQPITVTIHGTNDAPVIKYTGSYSLDQFNTQDYGAWIEVGNNSNGAQEGSPFNGEFQLAHDPTTAAGNFQIRLTDLDAESDVPDTLTRTYNLVGAGNTAKIEFDYRRDIPSGQSNDQFIVLVSINGGPFTQIGQIGATGNGSFVDGSYQHFTFDLASGSTIQTVALRFSVGDNVDDGDVVYVDNVKLSYATTASATQAINYTENSAVGLLPPQITDADHNATVHSAAITLTNHQANDLLSVTGTLPGGIAASSYDAATGLLTLTGTASLADYQNALSHILYSNTSDNPNTDDRTLTITVNDGLADSTIATATIHVTAIDDLPFATADNVITNFGTNNAFQIPNSALLANDVDLDNTLNITNVSGASGGTASLGGGSVTFNDTGGSGGSFNYTATGGALTTSAHVTITQDTSGALDGTSGNDILIAKPGAVTMNGNDGNDFLISNTGAQIMNGGAGDDTFVFRAIADSTPGAGNFDTLGDFVHNSDHLDLTAIAGATSVQGLVNSANTVDAHSISWFVDNAHNQTIVYVNTTGTVNHVDMEIHVTGTNINLSGSDILHHT
jgi:VCBS repeat-containing protein